MNKTVLYAMDGLDCRPTIDIDFMADRISRDRTFLEGVFKEILSIPCEMDGVTFDFPLLLQDIPSVNIQAYSIETVLAEKFHTMIDRDVQNSRMKDFFDCYQILTTKEVDSDVLRDAIFATFDNRGLVFNPDLQLFTDDFVTDETRLIRWKSFLRKIKWKQEIPFSDVMSVISSQLKGIMDDYWTSHRS